MDEAKQLCDLASQDVEACKTLWCQSAQQSLEGAMGEAQSIAGGGEGAAAMWDVGLADNAE
eukprot:2897616-Prorocentrum_lima.AAC.1